MRILSIGIKGDDGGAMVAKRQMDERLSSRGHTVNSEFLPNPHPAVPHPSSVIRLLKIARGYDIVHCHGIVGSHALSAAVTLGIGNTPLIYHTQTSFLTELSWKEKHLLEYLLRFQTRLADAVNFVSDLEKELLGSYISKKPNWYVIENRAEIQDIQIANSHSLPELPDEYVISVGTVSDRKGQAWLVEAMREVDEMALVLVGQVETDIHERIREYGLKDRVISLGRLDHTSTQSLIANAEALVHLSQYESFGIVIAEALAHGVPVVCTERCGAKSLVSGSNGIVVPVDAPLTEVVDAIERATRLSPAADSRPTDWEGLLDELEAVYDRALSGSPSKNRQMI